MGEMIEMQPNGTFLCYLKHDFMPADKETAEVVKIIYPDGRVVFAKPEAKKA